MKNLRAALRLHTSLTLAGDPVTLLTLVGLSFMCSLERHECHRVEFKCASDMWVSGDEPCQKHKITYSRIQRLKVGNSTKDKHVHTYYGIMHDILFPKAANGMYFNLFATYNCH